MKSIRLTTALAAITLATACASDQIFGPKPPTQLNKLTLVSHDFENGTIGPYQNYHGSGWIDFPNDPTGSGRGKVARMHYVTTGPGVDDNKGLDYDGLIHDPGDPAVWFKGDFYVPVSNISSPHILRKLVYVKGHQDWAKYTVNGGSFVAPRFVVQHNGNDLVVDATYHPHPSTGLNDDDVRRVFTVSGILAANTWYQLKYKLKMETTRGGSDGQLGVWVREANNPASPGPWIEICNITNMRWTEPLWHGDTSNPTPYDSADEYFAYWVFGQQVQGSSAIDEYRYWDNVEFSTTDDWGPGGGATVLAEDTFVGTNETQLTNHTPTGTYPGTSWSTAYGEGRDFELENGRVRADQGGYLKRRDVLNKAGGYPNDYKIAATFVFQQPGGDDYFYIGARTASTGLAGYYFGYETYTDHQRFRLIRGDGTVLDTWSFPYPAIGTEVFVELIVNGNTITGRVNGVNRVVATDSQYTSGLPSIYFFGATGPDPGPAGVHLDNFSVSSP